MITVSTEVKALCEKAAKLACEKLKVKFQQYNQDINAYAANIALNSVGDDADKKLQVLKKFGNASAMRQAIDPTSGKKAAETIANELVSELLETSID